MGITESEPRVGCGAALLQEGKLLLIQRRNEPEAGHWGFPGGKVDWLEPTPDAVVREVSEELGIELVSPELLTAVDQIDADAPAHWVALVYRAEKFTGEPTLMEPAKHHDFGWFDLNDLPDKLTTATRMTLPHLQAP
ncbi:NUDIX domain-containing protein [Nesterenkonia populi]